MNMLLPFLLDGDTRRIDAAGEQTAVLESWMLTGRDDAQPIAYLWLEMEKSETDRADEHLTFGCGIKGAALGQGPRRRARTAGPAGLRHPHAVGRPARPAGGVVAAGGGPLRACGHTGFVAVTGSSAAGNQRPEGGSLAGGGSEPASGAG
jgi:hypothetical protein